MLVWILLSIVSLLKSDCCADSWWHNKMLMPLSTDAHLCLEHYSYFYHNSKNLQSKPVASISDNLAICITASAPLLWNSCLNSNYNDLKDYCNLIIQILVRHQLGLLREIKNTSTWSVCLLESKHCHTKVNLIWCWTSLPSNISYRHKLNSSQEGASDVDHP